MGSAELSNFRKCSLCEAARGALVSLARLLPLALLVEDSDCSRCRDWTLLTATWRCAWLTLREETSSSTAVTLSRTSANNFLGSAMLDSLMVIEIRVVWVGSVEERWYGKEF